MCERERERVCVCARERDRDAERDGGREREHLLLLPLVVVDGAHSHRVEVVLAQQQSDLLHLFGKADVRLPGSGNSNSHGARPVY